ncbi:MAG: hypothetical protein ACRD22_08780 [Terriglobia bacterium]
MNLQSDFVDTLEAVHPRDLIEQLKSSDRPEFDTHWKIRNEIKPADLYCYLFARFGPPNGIQNFLRGDHSENLIHWEWTLRAHDRLLLIQGQNFRTEIWISGDELPPQVLRQLIAQIKSTFPRFGDGMGKIRNALEHWVEFVNPYQRILSSVESLTRELDALDVENEARRDMEFTDYENPEAWSKDWKYQAEIFSRATGICFGIRSMLPVMAEAFVNLLMYMLLKPALKKDDRLRENLIRQPIDVRIKSLSHSCRGFKEDVDYSHEACRRFHSLVNERNDLLHGNVVVDKLKFNELYFNGRVPIFDSYLSMWERAFGVSHSSVGLGLVKQERNVVDEFIGYVISCLDEKHQEEVRIFCEKRDLGLCRDDGHLGILFSGQLVDMRPGPKSSG